MNRQERLDADGAEVYATFYRPKDPMGWGSNFSEHGVWMINPFTLELEFHRTGEHRFQAMKATKAEDYAYVNGQGTAFAAKEAGRDIELREGWGNTVGSLCYLVMFELIVTKTLQHESIFEELMLTGKAFIYEDSPIDDIWGWRYRGDYRGKNLLGKCWMQTRDLLS